MAKKIPLRMCIVCREMRSKKEMLRIVKNAENLIFIDKTGKAAGRGAYICDNKKCVQDCLKKKMFNKVFKCEVPEQVYLSIGEDVLAKE